MKVTRFEKGYNVVCINSGGSKLLEVGKVYKVQRAVGTCIFIGTSRDGWDSYDFERVIPKIDLKHYEITFNQFIQSPNRVLRYMISDRKDNCIIGMFDKCILTDNVKFTLSNTQWWLNEEQMFSLAEVMHFL